MEYVTYYLLFMGGMVFGSVAYHFTNARHTERRVQDLLRVADALYQYELKAGHTESTSFWAWLDGKIDIGERL